MSMKLSEIRGERVLEVIADVIDPIANIAQDEAASAMFRREKPPAGVTAKSFMLERARKAAPALLRGHKADIIAILAAISNTTPEAYMESMSISKLLTDFIELMTDDCFTELFISARSRKSSGSAQENTGAL